jgi:hypothetical protein
MRANFDPYELADLREATQVPHIGLERALSVVTGFLERLGEVGAGVSPITTAATVLRLIQRLTRANAPVVIWQTAARSCSVLLYH